jgi:C1A family cysteine protease
VSQHKKKYHNSAAYDHAFNNFQKSIKRVAERQAKGKATYGLTKFADLSPAEFKAVYLNARMPKNLDKSRVLEPAHFHKYRNAHSFHGTATPAVWDWRTKHAVTPVKDQGQCGSCWAFSTTENTESQWFLSGKTLPKLAPQQLVDCDPQSQGCNGGWTYWAFQYLMSAGGMEAEASYPYQGQTGTCQFDASKIVAKVYNYTFPILPCEEGDCSDQAKLEPQMRAGLATIGPFSICVNAAPWQDYSNGVMTADECDGNSEDLDHCVQVVGYDTKQAYYIVRNSWNTDWGIDGYIYLQTDQNTCGIADVVTFADVVQKSE